MDLFLFLQLLINFTPTFSAYTLPTSLATSDFDFCRLAEIGRHPGPYFLKEQCWIGRKAYYRCPNTASYYSIKFDSIDNVLQCFHVVFDSACPEDPLFYQACGHGGCSKYHKQATTPMSCGTYICDMIRSTLPDPLVFGGGWVHHLIQCNNREDCHNTRADEEVCVDPKEYLCNNVCEDTLCRDESQCNGVEYGIQCSHNGYNYLPPSMVCNGVRDCPDGRDEGMCDGPDMLFCNDWFEEGMVIGVPPSSRCSVPYLNLPVCTNGMDQTNCTDPSRTAIRCPIGGYDSSVSKFEVCSGRQLCDDNFNNECVSPEIGCLVHKGRVCDGIVDCPNGGDESKQFCHRLSKLGCVRRLQDAEQDRELQIPISWVGDGVRDCKSGIDEDESYWRVCRIGSVTRYYDIDEPCEDLLVCHPDVVTDVVALPELCDKINSCEIENELCYESRGIPPTQEVVTEWIGGMYLHHCLPGLEGDLQHQMGRCVSVDKYISGPKLELSNVISPVSMVIPAEPISCKHMHGEQYVQLACTGHCTDAQCPLKPIPRSTCKNRPGEVVFAMASDQSVTVLLRSSDTPDHYTKDIFPCDNNHCVETRDVCNLVDDCGDGSDERWCANHFHCRQSGEFIPLSSVCDGHVDCLSYEDECNESCPKTNLFGSDTSIMYASWVIGTLATASNVFSCAVNLGKLRKTTTLESALNRTLLLLVSFGDFLMGGYLLALALINLKFDKNGSYCREKYQWLSSGECKLLGATSTTASQLSLFSMTVLSMFRLTVMDRMIQRRPRKRCLVLIVTSISILILLLSVTLGIVPLISVLEDFFVNGLYYTGVPLFVGMVTKDKHYNVFGVYYGRIRTGLAEMRWTKIRDLVDWMFVKGSKQDDDPIGMSNSTIHFYGNSGVCIFKYLVTMEDPQWRFSILVLAINIVCFALITTSYIFVSVKTIRSHRRTSSGCSNATKRQRTMQTKITAIILTDFACWIPFTIVCLLHFSKLVNASSWYPFFSTIILPINSVINPHLYNDVLIRKLLATLRKTGQKIGNSTVVETVQMGLRKQHFVSPSEIKDDVVKPDQREQTDTAL
eukprot:sb/3461461/